MTKFNTILSTVELGLSGLSKYYNNALYVHITHVCLKSCRVYSLLFNSEYEFEYYSYILYHYFNFPNHFLYDIISLFKYMYIFFVSHILIAIILFIHLIHQISSTYQLFNSHLLNLMIRVNY